MAASKESRKVAETEVSGTASRTTPHSKPSAKAALEWFLRIPTFGKMSEVMGAFGVDTAALEEAHDAFRRDRLKANAKLSAEAALDGFDFDEPVTALTEDGDLHMLFLRRMGKPLSFAFQGDGKALAMFDADFDDVLEMEGLPRVLTEAERGWIGQRLAAAGFLRSDKGSKGGQG